MMFITTTLTLTAVAIASTHAKIPPEMLSPVDTNVDPCDDFYQYACGGWMKSKPLQPTDMQVESSFTVIGVNNARVFHEIVKEYHPLLGEFWISCMIVNKITKLGNKPLQEDLNSIANAKTSFDALALTGEFSRTGMDAIVKFTVAADLNDATTNTFYMIPADLTLPSTVSYSDVNFPKIERAYKEYINNLMKLSGFSFPKMDRRVSAADTVITIERELANIKRHRSGETHRLPITDATQDLPITVGAFVNGLGLVEKTTIATENFMIYIERSEYFEHVEKYIKSIPVDDLKVYLAFVLVHSRVKWLGGPFFRVWFKFFGEKLSGQRQPMPRYDICMDSLIKYMPDLIGKYYYKKAFDTKRVKHALEMTKLIKDAMEEHIIHSTWLNTEDKKQAQIKLNKVVALIGQTTVPKSYPPVLSSDDYPANIYTILLHAFDAQMKKVGQRVNHMEWDMSSAKTNAYYSDVGNTIVFPAAILQPPLFNGPKVHPARNFGAIGTIMGHELTHGFDDHGSFFDGDGNINPWWTEGTDREFGIRTQCMKEQYSSFEVRGERGQLIGKVDGTLTLDENIADNGGVALAWDAYRKYMTTVQPKTNGVTPEEGDQIFFLAFGQTWCTKTRDEYMQHLLAIDPHSPVRWRVNGAVMNNNDFAKVFRCKANAPMNPINKCRIW